MALPERFVERFREIYPQEAEELLHTFRERRRVSFRINPLVASKEEVLDELETLDIRVEPVAWYPYAYTADIRFRETLTRSALFASGAIYIQSLSSMLAPLALDPRPGERVLDLAAAPGGKSLMMAAMMADRGWLSVVEPAKERFFRLKANLQRGGVTIAHHYMTDGRGVGAKCPAMFDRVMLDAPCSTEAKFRIGEPKSFAYWSERKIREMARLQYRLIRSAIKSLKPGGTLLYATCSFAPEENEAVVDKALASFDDLTVEPIDPTVAHCRPGLTSWRKKRFDPSLADTLRILPTTETDGFYLAKLRKKS